MRPIATRDKLIELQRASVTQDDHNEDVSSWEPIGKEYAAVLFGRGEERRQAAQMQASQSVTFQVLNNAVTRSLTARDRIFWNGIAWDIAAPGVPVRRGELEITATGAL
ncbi:head-tail adaptor protein [uncultured Novosphingobium sp.]|uniref:head-tail adaptor protein n=1 Tax=uncultured Novosphingobium sp. TaxID=292277 RepID=UPI00258F94B8|nr:head-tail adaptor protein [uncultured Novosphingobium sp.]